MMKTEPPTSSEVLAVEIDDVDPDALAEEVIDSWLGTPAGSSSTSCIATSAESSR